MRNTSCAVGCSWENMQQGECSIAAAAVLPLLLFDLLIIQLQMPAAMAAPAIISHLPRHVFDAAASHGMP